jgi:Tfp pilus assembly PilM family ATPase
MKSTRHLGVSFFNGHIQLAEIERGKKTSVTVLAEGQTSVDLVEAGIHLSADHPQVATLVGELGDMIKRNKVSTRSVSYALPAEPIFVNIIPLSASLTGKSLSDYLQWELKQYFPNAEPKDFILDSHPLPPSGKDSRPGFMVGVRRGMVSFLQRVTRDLKLELQIVDVDHLCTEKTLSYNYPEISGHHAALFCLRTTGMIASVVRGGEVIDYRWYAGQGTADCGKAVNSYLNELKQMDGMPPPDALFFYGLGVPPETVKQIRAETDIQTIVINSLRKLPLAGKVYEKFTKESNRFAPAIGLGLRDS